MNPNNSTEPLSYLALGDSYTIGELVSTSDNWPHQLQSQLINDGINFEEPKIIATTGWTTDELQTAIESAQPPNTFDLVSLSIGVNNQYRGYPIEHYKTAFESLLRQAIHFAKGNATRVFVISIPDYGVTPFAKEKNPSKISTELAQYNRIAESICEFYSVVFHDITSSSKIAEKDTSLLTEDELHPSAKMYQMWVNQIYTDIRNRLK